MGVGVGSGTRFPGKFLSEHARCWWVRDATPHTLPVLVPSPRARPRPLSPGVGGRGSGRTRACACQAAPADRARARRPFPSPPPPRDPQEPRCYRPPPPRPARPGETTLPPSFQGHGLARGGNHTQDTLRSSRRKAEATSRAP